MKAIVKQKKKTDQTDVSSTDDAGVMAIPSAPVLSEVLKTSNYGLTIFSDKQIKKLSFFLKRGTPYLRCFATGKDRPAKPEEVVRQLYLLKLMDEYGYPKERIAVEKPVYFGSAVHEKAADIIICDKADGCTDAG